jgi:hypothetical protein
MASATDNFTRSDGNIGGNHSAPVFSGQATPQISSNTLVGNGGNASAYYNDQTEPDWTIECTVTTAPTNDYDLISLYGSLQSPGTAGVDGYGLEIKREPGNSQLIISSITNGSGSALGNSFEPSIANGDRYKFEKIGSTLNAYKWLTGAWSLRVTATDSTYGAGYVGVGFLNGGSGAMDDVTITGLPDAGHPAAIRGAHIPGIKRGFGGQNGIR